MTMTFTTHELKLHNAIQKLIRSIRMIEAVDPEVDRHALAYDHMNRLLRDTQIPARGDLDQGIVDTEREHADVEVAAAGGLVIGHDIQDAGLAGGPGIPVVVRQPVGMVVDGQSIELL